MSSKTGVIALNLRSGGRFGEITLGAALINLFSTPQSKLRSGKALKRSLSRPFATTATKSSSLMIYLDIPADELDDAADVITSRTSVVPYASYPHPDQPDFHRMEFELRVNMNIVKTALDRANIETFVA